jgi:ATP-dependent RNA helicase RhlE
VEQSRKTALLKNLLAREEFATALVFTRTKHKAKNVARQLEAAGFLATSIQGNLSQSKRQEAMDGFRQGTFKILVATDIAARGIDVKGISHVINYDVPDTVAAYTHRIGRTGRASLTGDAITFASREDGVMIRDIERTLGKSMARQSLPEQLATEAPDDRPERPRRSFTPGGKPKSDTRRPSRGAAPLGFNRRPASGRTENTGRRSFSS